MEKNERMAKKRNLEGNTSNYNSFSALPVEDIITVTADMGVILDATDFDTFDILKDLEQARNNLYQKQCDKVSAPQTETVEEDPRDNKNLDLIWIHYESSKSDDFILVESRKKKRENIKISPSSKGNDKIRKGPDLIKCRRGRTRKVTSSKTIKSVKNDATRLDLEL